MVLKEKHKGVRSMAASRVQRVVLAPVDQNNADLYAEEVAAAKAAEIERMTAVPGLLDVKDVKLEDYDDD